jgi:protein TonB
MAAAPLNFPARMQTGSRNTLIAGGVVLLHVAALWALQSGLLRRAVETVVPVELLSVLVTPPRTEAPPTPPQPQPVQPAPAPVRRVAPPTPAPAPKPVAAPEPSPAPPAVTATSEPQPAPPPISAPVTAAPAPAITAAPAPAPAPAPKVELPTTDADYLHNPPPVYPRLSFRLGEEGLVVVRVLIGTDGRAQDAQIAKSSGFSRLDQAAEATARGWRYVPGKRGGVPEPMWVNVPIRWEIKKD